MINTEIRIYVANLAKYNEGKLVGKWIDLPCTTLDKQIEEILGDDEEFAIHDFECDIIDIDQNDDPHELNEMAEKIDELCEGDILKIKYLVRYGYDLGDALEKMDDVIFYPNMTLAEVAEEMVDEGLFGEVPDTLKYYIDYDAIVRDLRHDNYSQEDEGVFYYS